MSTTTKEQVSTSLEEILSQPYILILWKDNYNTFDWVIECLMKICKHDQEQAAQCSFLVHYIGKCDVKRGDQETIQKMYNKLKSAGLTVTMEMI
jgi:ATP-dependent Clp protease adaptor protein ClpS